MAQDEGNRDAADGPLVSILMPVFNQETYVGEAIGSAQGQSYSNIEILIHDDGSTDRTGEIVEGSAARDPRIRFTRATQNQGVADARNELITRARGSFICWLDSDDLMAADKVRVQHEFLEANPAVAAVATSTRPINAAGRSLPGGRSKRAQAGRREIFLPAFATVTTMYRREALMAAFPLRPLKDGSDIDLVLRVAASGEIAEIPAELYIRRFHGGQMSKSADSGHMIAVASNIYRSLDLADVIAGPAIDEPAILRQILRDRHALFSAVAEQGNTAWDAVDERRFALVLVLLHTVRRIGTWGERLATVAGCLRHAPRAFVRVVSYWSNRRLRPSSRYP